MDLLAVAAVETAGTAAVLTDLEEQVREAILAVAAATYSDESQQVVVGTPADLAMLVGTTPANAGDLGSVPVGSRARRSIRRRRRRLSRSPCSRPEASGFSRRRCGPRR